MSSSDDTQKLIQKYSQDTTDTVVMKRRSPTFARYIEELIWLQIRLAPPSFLKSTIQNNWTTSTSGVCNNLG